MMSWLPWLQRCRHAAAAAANHEQVPSVCSTCKERPALQPHAVCGGGEDARLACAREGCLQRQGARPWHEVDMLAVVLLVPACAAAAQPGKQACPGTTKNNVQQPLQRDLMAPPLPERCRQHRRSTPPRPPPLSRTWKAAGTGLRASPGPRISTSTACVLVVSDPKRPTLFVYMSCRHGAGVPDGGGRGSLTIACPAAWLVGSSGSQRRRSDECTQPSTAPLPLLKRPQQPLLLAPVARTWAARPAAKRLPACPPTISCML